MIPSSAIFDQSVMQHLLDLDPVVQDYRAFFSCLDWSLLDQWQAERSSGGRPPHPESAYLKAFLVRLREGLSYTSQLRRFLLKHPLLVIELAFISNSIPPRLMALTASKRFPVRFACARNCAPLTRTSCKTCWPLPWRPYKKPSPAWAKPWPSMSSTSLPGCARTTPMSTSKVASM